MGVKCAVYSAKARRWRPRRQSGRSASVSVIGAECGRRLKLVRGDKNTVAEFAANCPYLPFRLVVDVHLQASKMEVHRYCAIFVSEQLMYVRTVRIAQPQHQESWRCIDRGLLGFGARGCLRPRLHATEVRQQLRLIRVNHCHTGKFAGPAVHSHAAPSSYMWHGSIIGSRQRLPGCVVA